MADYEARRLANIKRNEHLVKDLGLQDDLVTLPKPGPKTAATQKTSSVKRRKPHTNQPTRTSSRIANAPSKPTYTDDPVGSLHRVDRRTRTRPSLATLRKNAASTIPEPPSPPAPDLESLTSRWTSWEPAAPSPTRDENGTYHFDSHADFLPNKSPEDIMREGSFGGSYWRPLFSRRLGITVTDDWRELPEAWTTGLDVGRYMTSPEYDPEVNKFGVSCGQSIEEWEAAGWINHEYDVRGWFQWYCRFWMGRRCEDDERQISRWRKCVGETGRWRRILLKKYVQKGIKNVADEGDELDDDERSNVSPVVHQTCHHWAYEVRQEALDRFWEEGR